MFQGHIGAVVYSGSKRLEKYKQLRRIFNMWTPNRRQGWDHNGILHRYEVVNEGIDFSGGNRTFAKCKKELHFQPPNQSSTESHTGHTHVLGEMRALGCLKNFLGFFTLESICKRK